MTTLEITLTAIIWIGYGVVAYCQTDERITDDIDTLPLWAIYIVISPVIFIGKCLYGAFKKYE